MVSIIVPIYNTGSYLNQCLKSIVEQTYSYLDIILVDDGSTDDSVSICKDFASRDNRIRLFSQQNGGASAARNLGLKHTIGEFVMFVDSDDWIENVMVERLIQEMTSSQASLVISNVPGDKKTYEDTITMESYKALGLLLQGAWWGPVGKLFLKKHIGKLRFPKATISEDYVFMAELLSKDGIVFYTPHCYYHRETRDGSLSHLALSKRKFEEYDNVSYVARFIKENHPQFKKLAEARMAETSLKLLFCIYANGDPMAFRDERKKLVKSIRSNIIYYVFNKEILAKMRLLLLMCITSPSARMAHKAYMLKHH
ncbi:MAG: glycosyltransferase [Prevotella sp.]|nr:glycosyltransferase [Prevotella sp.]